MSQMQDTPSPKLMSHSVGTQGAGERGSWMVVMGQMLTPLWEGGTLELGGGSLIIMATTAQARLSLGPEESKSVFLRSRAGMRGSGPLCPEASQWGCELSE